METTRYFNDGDSWWKFESGKHPLFRTSISSEWADSVFGSLEEFLAEPEPVPEIPARDAEVELIGR